MFYLPLLLLLAADLPVTQPATHPLDRATVLNAMRKALAASPESSDANIEIVDMSRFPVPDGEVEFDWKALTPPAAEQSTSRWRGVLRRDENHVFSIWAVVRLTVPCTRITAAEIIRPEEAITASQIREVPYLGFPSESCRSSAGSVIGKVATRTILANTPIVGAMLAAPASVLKGEQAIAEYRGDAVWLSLPVIPERNGRMGDVIRVLNPQSHKTLLAQVIGEGKVLIESGSRAVDLTTGDRP
jgi:flagella basal body P-ring formation protein FlgA